MGKIQGTIKYKDLILMIITILIIIINLILIVRNILIPKQQDEKNFEYQQKMISQAQKKESENENKTVTVSRTDEEIRKKLASLRERDRIEYYCGEYIKHIKSEEYEAAYNMLYTEFKQNYFPTIEDYEEYVKSFYPEFFTLQYDDITRQGDIYVLRLKIIDISSSSNDEEENIQRIVIKENDYNDFVISFQVK